MGFVIKCEKCGNEQLFNNRDKRRKENIEIEAEQFGYEGTIRYITLYCENSKCNQWVELDY